MPPEPRKAWATSDRVRPVAVADMPRHHPDAHASVMLHCHIALAITHPPEPDFIGKITDGILQGADCKSASPHITPQRHLHLRVTNAIEMAKTLLERLRRVVGVDPFSRRLRARQSAEPPRALSPKPANTTKPPIARHREVTSSYWFATRHPLLWLSPVPKHVCNVISYKQATTPADIQVPSSPTMR